MSDRQVFYKWLTDKLLRDLYDFYRVDCSELFHILDSNGFVTYLEEDDNLLSWVEHARLECPYVEYDGPISSLEVLIYLADTVAFQQTVYDNIETSAPFLYEMLDSMGILHESNRAAIEDVVDAWVDRDYDDMGHGTPFLQPREYPEYNTYPLHEQLELYVNNKYYKFE